jgi:hypothetical protein
MGEGRGQARFDGVVGPLRVRTIPRIRGQWLEMDESFVKLETESMAFEAQFGGGSW